MASQNDSKKIKDARMDIPINSEDLRQLQDRAKYLGISLAEFVRRSSLNQRLPSFARAMAALYEELGYVIEEFKDNPLLRSRLDDLRIKHLLRGCEDDSQTD